MIFSYMLSNLLSLEETKGEVAFKGHLKGLKSHSLACSENHSPTG